MNSNTKNNGMIIYKFILYIIVQSIYIIANADFMADLKNIVNPPQTDIDTEHGVSYYRTVGILLRKIKKHIELDNIDDAITYTLKLYNKIYQYRDINHINYLSYSYSV